VGVLDITRSLKPQRKKSNDVNDDLVNVLTNSQAHLYLSTFEENVGSQLIWNISHYAEVHHYAASTYFVLHKELLVRRISIKNSEYLCPFKCPLKR
jgi:hypothetical protein